MHDHTLRPTGFLRVFLLGVFVALLAPSGPSYAHEPLSASVAEITRRLEQAPNAPDFLKRGELLRLEGHFDEALRDYAQAARLDSSLRDIQLCRGALALDTGDPAQALIELDRFLASGSPHSQAYRLRARALLALGRPREAVSDFDRSLAASERPSPDQYFERARALSGLGDEAKLAAVAGLDRGIERLGPLVSLHTLAIDLEMELGRYDAALARLDAIAPQFGRRETMLDRRGQILLAAGRREEARAAFAAALAEIESRPAQRRTTRANTDLETRLRKALAELLAEANQADSGERP